MMNKYAELDILKDRLNEYRKNEHPKVTRALEIEYTYESNKIEGNTLTLQETALVIEKGLTVGGKTMTEHLEVINHSQAIDYIKGLAKSKNTISERDILQIHSLILQAIDKPNAGVYRKVPVIISGAKHMPPQPFLIAEKMEGLLLWYAKSKDVLHPVELSAEIHERLVTIHPFIDGNGRTSRLLMNLILLQNGYPIAILKGDDKSRLAYYNALEVAQTENNKKVFIALITKNIEDTIKRILAVFE
ncbi:Fic family protein [Tenacibaculum finnmarkense]|nr:Fic family protein [Tenacibaculum finnmarkense genomovar ulcerans]MCG8732814.1 Fic family protein [Tenacibaculum finnmarkense]MBE7646975.1 Fic family protein [Tenacibaculum finnmarkense genomovar ulcerans]MCG8761672.1 Fic family protein [Tenacibaculum finnmarkense]MCG8784577.1 Fic family protein [Tenacibaculum finnmarkense]